jgi:hypothetical protein
MIARLIGYMRDRAPTVADADSMILTLLVRAIAALEVARSLEARS